MDQWRRDHKLLLHGEQAALSEKDVVNPFKATACFRLGMCVCGKRGELAVRMVGKLGKALRNHFGTKKDASDEHKAWQNGFYVLQLVSATSQDIYLHVGSTNFRTWEMCALKLFPRHYNPFEETLMLQVAGEDGNDGISVKMVLKFVLDELDLKEEFNFQLWRMVSDNSNVPENLMPSCYVDIRKEGDKILFWNGAAAEKTRRKRKMPATQRKGTGSRSNTKRSRDANEMDLDAEALDDLKLNQEQEPYDEGPVSDNQDDDQNDTDSDLLNLLISEVLDEDTDDVFQDNEDLEDGDLFDDQQPFQDVDQLLAHLESEVTADLPDDLPDVPVPEIDRDLDIDEALEAAINIDVDVDFQANEGAVPEEPDQNSDFVRIRNNIDLYRYSGTQMLTFLSFLGDCCVAALISDFHDI